MPTLSNFNWRVIYGAAGVAIATILATAPSLEIEIPPIVLLGLIVANAVIAFLKAPPDAPQLDPGGEG